MIAVLGANPAGKVRTEYGLREMPQKNLHGVLSCTAKQLRTRVPAAEFSEERLECKTEPSAVLMAESWAILLQSTVRCQGIAPSANV